MAQNDLSHEPGVFFAFLRGLEKVIWPVSSLFGIAGMVGGFYVGGLGGAIVGAPVGFIVGFVLVYSLPVVLAGAAAILAIGLGIALSYGSFTRYGVSESRRAQRRWRGYGMDLLHTKAQPESDRTAFPQSRRPNY